MSTFAELKRQVVMKLEEVPSGEVMLTVEQAINDAMHVIAMVEDFDDLMVMDTTNAATVEDQKLYHIEDDLSLERPKDIYSIRLMDEGNSRKLIYVPPTEIDLKIPYTEISGTGRSKWYTRRGKYIELYRIPDDAYDLYVYHSQWPEVMDADSDTIPFANLDLVIVTLAVDMSVRGGSVTDWLPRAKELLALGVREEGDRPDAVMVAKPFSPSEDYFGPGEYWVDPFYKGAR